MRRLITLIAILFAGHVAMQAQCITCPSDEVINISASCEATLPEYEPSSNSCPTGTHIQEPAAGTVLTGLMHNQDTTVWLIAVNGSGARLDSCSITVTFADVDGPSFTCPADREATLDEDCSFPTPNVITELEGTGVDCSNSITYSQSPIAGLVQDSYGHDDTLFITVTATDSIGNDSACVVKVVAKDGIAPTVDCPGPTITVGPNVAGECLYRTRTGQQNGDDIQISLAIDNCSTNPDTTYEIRNTEGTILFSGDGNIGDPGNIHDLGPGSYTVIYTVTDAAGLQGTCSFSLVVEDSNDPEVVQCIEDQEVSLGTESEINLADALVYSFSDDCDTDLDTTFTRLTASCTDVGLDPFDVTITVTDDGGNQASCTVSVTVTDDTAPVCVDLADITVYLDADGQGALGDDQVASIRTQMDGQDNCGIGEITPPTLSCEDITEDPMPIDIMIADINGNVATCPINAAVLDTIKPVCRTMDLSVEIGNSGQVDISVDDIDDGSSDNCGIASRTLSQTTFTCDDVAGSPISVVLTVVDDAGNESTCTAQVTVSDPTPPSFDCPADLTVGNDAGGCDAVVDGIALNNLSDNCGDAPVVNWELTGQTTGSGTDDASGTTFNAGTSTVTYTVRDQAGNEASCSFTVTVVDDTAPEANCQDITVDLDDSGNATIAEDAINDESFDQCGGLSFDTDITTFSCDDLDNSPLTLTLTVSDGANVSTCTAQATIRDVTAPVCEINNNQEFMLVDGEITITTDMIDNGTSDACDGTNLTLEIVGGSTFTCDNLGTQMITFRATDGSNNSCTEAVTVIIVDGEAPEALCVSSLSVELDNVTGTYTLDPSELDNSSFDLCASEVTLSTNAGTFDCDDAGNTIDVTLTVSDGSLTDECVVPVTVTDNTAPVANCQDIATEITANGEILLMADEFDDGTTEACAFDLLINGEQELIFDCTDADEEPISITLTAVDHRGNSDQAECELTIDGAIQAVASTNAPICEGETLELTESINGIAADYEWRNSSGVLISTDPDPQIDDATEAFEDIYTVTVTAPNGCEAQASVAVEAINRNPEAGMSVPDGGIFDRGLVTIEEDSDQGEGGWDTWIWDFDPPGEFGGNFVFEFPTVQPGHPAAERYDFDTTVNVCLTVIDANGCEDKTSEEIFIGRTCVVRTQVDGNSEDALEFCDGSDLEDLSIKLQFPFDGIFGTLRFELSSSSITGDFMSRDINESDTDDGNIDINIGNVSFPGPGVYTIRAVWEVSGPGGVEVCNISNELQVTINENPSAIFSAPDTVCQGSSLPVNYEFTDGSAEHEWTYKIDEEAFLNPPDFEQVSGTINMPNTSDLTPGTHTLEISSLINEFGCESDGVVYTKEFFVSEAPRIEGPTFLLGDDELIVSFSIFGGQSGYTLSDDRGSTYDKVAGENRFTTVISCQELDTVGDIELALTVLDAAGCSTDGTFVVSRGNCSCPEDKGGAINISSGDGSICEGEMITISVADSGVIFSNDVVYGILFDPSSGDSLGRFEPIISKTGLESTDATISFSANEVLALDPELFGKRLAITRAVGKEGEGDLLIDSSSCNGFADDIAVIFYRTPEVELLGNLLCPGQFIGLDVNATVPDGENEINLILVYQYRDATGALVGSQEEATIIFSGATMDYEVAPQNVTAEVRSIELVSVRYASPSINCIATIDGQSSEIVDFGVSGIQGDLDICAQQYASGSYSFDGSSLSPDAVITWIADPSQEVISEGTSARILWTGQSGDPFTISVIIEDGACVDSSSLSITQTFNGISPRLRELLIKGTSTTGPDLLIYPNASENSGNEAPERYCFGRSPKTDLYDPNMDESLPDQAPGFERAFYEISDLDTANFAYWVEVIPSSNTFSGSGNNACAVSSDVCNTRAYANTDLKVLRTQIPDLGFDLSYKLYPNPTRNSIVIETDGDYEGDISWRLINGVGQVTAQNTFNKLKGLTQEALDLRGAPPGVYFLETVNDQLDRKVHQIIIL